MPNAVAPLVIGVTSHRNLAPDEVEPLRAKVRALLAALRHDFPGLPLQLLSSLAAGGDQLVAEVALGAGARVVAPLPFARDTYAQDFDAADRARFDDLCARVELLELPLLPGSSAADIATPGDARNRQYAQAGVFVASHSHILIAIWDGRPSGRLGGTAQTARYHLHGIMPGWIERRQSHRVLLDSGDESLLYHIACSRRDASGHDEPPLPPLQPMQARWLTGERVFPADGGMPADFHRMFARMHTFNHDAARYAAEIRTAVRRDARTGGDLQPAVDGLFAAADWLAVHFQRQVLRAMRGLYLLAVLMGIAFVCYSDLPPNLPHTDDAIYVFVVLFAAGVWLAWLGRRREWHRKYIDYRALAEGLRVQRYWRRAGVEASDPGAFPHDNFMQKQDVELGWIRNVMRAAAIDAPAIGASNDAALAAVVAEWIGTADGNGQLGYYAHKAAQRGRIHRHTQSLSRSLLVVVIAASVVLAAFHRRLGTDTTDSLVALMGVLAVIAAARESYAYRKADKELIKQYRYMSGIFASARRKLDAAANSGHRRDILRALGEAALAEHAEWALMHRERPLEHGKL